MCMRNLRMKCMTFPLDTRNHFCIWQSESGNSWMVYCLLVECLNDSQHKGSMHIRRMGTQFPFFCTRIHTSLCMTSLGSLQQMHQQINSVFNGVLIRSTRPLTFDTVCFEIIDSIFVTDLFNFTFVSIFAVNKLQYWYIQHSCKLIGYVMQHVYILPRLTLHGFSLHSHIRHPFSFFTNPNSQNVRQGIDAQSRNETSRYKTTWHTRLHLPSTHSPLYLHAASIGQSCRTLHLSPSSHLVSYWQRNKSAAYTTPICRCNYLTWWLIAFANLTAVDKFETISACHFTGDRLTS